MISRLINMAYDAENIIDFDFYNIIIILQTKNYLFKQQYIT